MERLRTEFAENARTQAGSGAFGSTPKAAQLLPRSSRTSRPAEYRVHYTSTRPGDVSENCLDDARVRGTSIHGGLTRWRWTSLRIALSRHVLPKGGANRWRSPFGAETGQVLTLLET